MPTLVLAKTLSRQKFVSPKRVCLKSICQKNSREFIFSAGGAAKPLLSATKSVRSTNFSQQTDFSPKNSVVDEKQLAPIYTELPFARIILAA